MDTVDKIAEHLEKLGDRLSPYAQQGWEILVRQQYIRAIATWAEFIGLLFMGYIGIRLVMKYKDKIKGKEDLQTGLVVMAVIFFIVILVSFIVSVGMIRPMLNPEYYAIKELLPK